MNKENFVTKKYFDKVLGEHSKVILEAVGAGFEENKKEHKKLEEKIDKNWKAIDGYVKKQENFKEEFVIIKEEMKQAKHILKEKLGVEISAV